MNIDSLLRVSWLFMDELEFIWLSAFSTQLVLPANCSEFSLPISEQGWISATVSTMRNGTAFWSVAKEFRRVLIFWTIYFKYGGLSQGQSGPSLVHKRSYRGRDKRSTWNSLFLYYLLIIVVLSIRTIKSLLLPHPVLPEKPKDPKSIDHWERSWSTLSWKQYAVTAPPEFATHYLTLDSTGNTKMNKTSPSKAQPGSIPVSKQLWCRIELWMPC